MQLQSMLLQSLVNKIIEDIGCNINIIDENGVIVASGSADRIGSFHKIGEEAARLEKRIDINKDNAHMHAGVKEGINQPFYHNGKLAGVIGITGNPEKIEEFVKLVKSMIELMFDQEALKNKMYIRESNKAFFVNLIVNMKSEDDRLSVTTWAQRLRYDFNCSRVAILISVKEILENTTNEDPEYLKERIVNAIKKSGVHKREDISSYISPEHIIILKTIPEVPQARDENIGQYIESARCALRDQFSGMAYFGIGNPFTGIDMAKESYSEARFALGKALKEKTQVRFIKDCLLDYFCAKLPEASMHRFFHSEYLKIADKPELIVTMQYLAQYNLNIAETSKALYIHRNTAIFRLNKLKALFNLDPLNHPGDKHFWDLLTVYISNRMD